MFNCYGQSIMITLFKVSPEDFPAQDNLFQTAWWGKFKINCGQKAMFFLCKYSNEEFVNPIDFPLMILLRKSTCGMYAYAPKAPSVVIPESHYGLLLEQLSEELKNHLPKEIVCIRYDTIWKSPYGNAAKDSLEIPRNNIRELRMNFGTEFHKLKKAKRDHFCPDTVIINPQKTPEQLLKNMRQTTKNCIRKSYKEEVIFSEKSLDFLPVWHKLYKETGKRKQFYTEELEYFKKLTGKAEGEAKKCGRIFFKQVASPHEDCGKGPPVFNKTKKSSIMSANPESMPVFAPVPKPTFHILTAEKKSKLLTGMILGICGKSAYYMYSGSEPEYNNFMAGYGLQWEAILKARSAGCTRYDLLGIPPTGNPSHFMNGLYTFKTGFGGSAERYCGCWDYPLIENQYDYFSNAEEFQELVN